MANELRKIAKQLWDDLDDECITGTFEIALLERAMRLRDEAWRSQLVIFGEEYEEAEWAIPTSEQLNTRMVELLKTEDRK